MEEKIIFESSDELMITQIEALLEENKIAYIRRDLGCGSYITIIMGQSYSTKQILVSENDFDKAKELKFKPRKRKNDVQISKEEMKIYEGNRY